MLLRLIFFVQIFVLMRCVGSMAQSVSKPKLNSEKLHNAQQTEREAIAKKDSALLAEAYYLYGKLYRVAGDDLTSEKYFLKSLRILELRGDSYELGRLYIRLSENYKQRLPTQQEIRNVNLAIGIFTRINSAKGLMIAYGILGQLYQKQWQAYDLTKYPSKYKTILTCFRKSEKLAYQLNDTLAIAETNAQLGGFYVSINDPRAITSFQKSLDLFTQKKTIGALPYVAINLADAYMRFDQLDKAYNALIKAKQLHESAQLNSNTVEVMLLKNFVFYYERTGQWKRSLMEFRELYELEKNKFIPERDEAIARINIEYETQKKEARLKSQQREIALRTENEQNQRWFLAITLTLLIVAVGATVAFYRLYRKNQRISQQNEDLVREQNHRVKNNLQIVSSLLSLQSRQLSDGAAKHAVTESQLRIQSMSILHRRLYDGEELAKVNLPEFMRELVQGILKIFGYQFITPTFAIDTIHLHADKAVPLALIINELVTNACKYAFPYTDIPILAISCQQKGSKLQLIVADNGPGLEDVSANDEGVVVAKKTFGMKLIKSQAEQLYATYHFEQGRGAVFRMTFKV